MKKTISLNVLIMFIGVVFTIFFCETLLRFTGYRSLIRNNPPYPRYYHKADDASGYDISENFPAANHYLPEIAYKVWSNNIGCFDYPYKGEKDYILLAGDSFTWGYAPFEYKYGTILENRIGMRVLKCGVSGYGARQEFIKIKKILEKTKKPPRLIIVGYYLGTGAFNDFVDDWLFPACAVIDGHLVNKTVPKDYISWERTTISDGALKKQMANWERFGRPDEPRNPIERIGFWLDAHSVIYKMLLKNISVFKVKSAPEKPKEEYVPIFYQIGKYPYLKKAWEEHLGYLEEIKLLADKEGSGFLVVLIPPKELVYDFLGSKDRDLGKPSLALQNILTGKSIDCLDLSPLFSEYADSAPKKDLDPVNDLYWNRDIHWNIKGNRLAGLLISKYMLEKGLLEIPGKEEKLKAIEEELNGFHKM